MHYIMLCLMLILPPKSWAVHNCVQLKNKLSACEPFSCIDNQQPKKAISKLENYKRLVESEGGDPQLVQEMYDESQVKQPESKKAIESYSRKYNFNVNQFIDLEGIAEPEVTFHQRKINIANQTSSGFCHYIEQIQNMTAVTQYECLLSYENIHYLLQTEDSYLIRSVLQAPFFKDACFFMSQEEYVNLTEN